MVLSEALYPASALPWPLSLIASSLPFTYFVRATHDVLFYGTVSSYIFDGVITLLLGLSLLLMGLIAFRAGGHRGRSKGFINRKSV